MLKTIECEEFYELCQSYRRATYAGVFDAYQALIQYIDKKLEVQHDMPEVQL